jgi:hypothetical protein
VSDLRLDLSPIRTPNRRSAIFSTAIASSVLALAAVATAAAASLPGSGPVAAARTLSGSPALTTAAAPAGREAAAPGASLDGSAALISQVQVVTARISPAEHGISQSRPATKRARHLSPRQLGRQMLRAFHWSPRQFTYLNRLWNAESSWNVHAANPFSGAYGIPQAVPGGKMASAGPNWRTNAATQIRWGLRYIRAVYGSPQRAWAHEEGVGWY